MCVFRQNERRLGSSDETVIGNTSNVALQTSATAVLLQNGVTFTATVTFSGTGTPTGSVTFMDGSTNMGSTVLDASGISVLSVNTLKQLASGLEGFLRGGLSRGRRTSSA